MTGEHPDWEAVTEARIPAADLVRLAPLRTRPDIRVRVADGIAWLKWTTSRAEAIRELLPSSGAEFFATAKGLRYRLGSRLPTGDAPPAGEYLPLATVLLPSPATVAEPDAGNCPDVALRLLRCGTPDRPSLWSAGCQCCETSRTVPPPPNSPLCRVCCRAIARSYSAGSCRPSPVRFDSTAAL